ncbi:hypothetical protein ACFL51_02095, partial [Myxococcota bacterium]
MVTLAIGLGLGACKSSEKKPAGKSKGGKAEGEAVPKGMGAAPDTQPVTDTSAGAVLGKLDGRAGGAIKGPHGFTMVVPKGAFPAGGKIVVRSTNAPPGAPKPHGKVFQIDGPKAVAGKPIVLAMSYDASRLPKGTTARNIRVVTWAGRSWVPLPTTVDVKRKLLLAHLDHFSAFSWIADKAFNRAMSDPVIQALSAALSRVVGPDRNLDRALKRHATWIEQTGEDLLNDYRKLTKGMEKTAAIGPITIGGKTYQVVKTNLTTQTNLPGVQDQKGQWLTNTDEIFRVLLAHQVRTKLADLRKGNYRKKLVEAANILGGMSVAHALTNTLDLLQSVLSKLLAYKLKLAIPIGSVNLQKQPKWKDLLSPDNLRNLNAMLAEVELFRFFVLFRELDDILARPAPLPDHEAFAAYAVFMDSRSRVDALKAFADATLPKGSWVTITAKKIAGAIPHIGKTASELVDRKFTQIELGKTERSRLSLLEAATADVKGAIISGIDAEVFK